jgi:hypothetical protein
VIFFLLLACVGCDPANRSAIHATVRVVDAVTGKPIPHAAVLVVALFEPGGWGPLQPQPGDSLVAGTADARGVLRVSFPQAFLVAAAAQAPGYLPARRMWSLTPSPSLSLLPLRRSRSNPTLRTALFISPLGKADPALPWLAPERDEERPPVVVKVDYCPQSAGARFRDTYGLVLSRARASRDTTACDFWLAPSETDHPPTVLVAGGQGGVYPLFSQGYAHSSLFDSDQAPARGYFRRYVLTGKEAGFFVRTRDGQHYGKYLLGSSGSGFLAGSTDLQEPACTYWWEGSCLYQANGSRNLAIGLGPVSLPSFLQGAIP